MPTPSRDSQGRRQINAGDFRDRSLGYLDDVARTGEEIVVLKRGKPVAVISPAVRRPGNTFIGSSRNMLSLNVPLGLLNQVGESNIPKALLPETTSTKPPSKQQD